MRADAHLDQPHAILGQGAVGVACVSLEADIRVLRQRIGQIGHVHGARFCNLFFGAGADKDGLALPEHRQLRAGIDGADVHADRRKRKHVRRGVHLID